MKNTVTINYGGTVFIACLRRKWKTYQWWIAGQPIGPVFRSRLAAQRFAKKLEKVTVKSVFTDAYRNAPFQEDLIFHGQRFPLFVGHPSRRYAKVSDYPYKPVQVFEYKFHLPERR